MSAPQDIKLNDDRTFEVDHSGDIAAEEENFVAQDTVVRLFNEITLSEPITQRYLEEIESEIQRILRNSEWVDPPFTINTYPGGPETVVIDITTDDREVIVPIDVT